MPNPAFVTVYAETEAEIHSLVDVAAHSKSPYLISHVPVSSRWPKIMPALKARTATLVRELVKAVK